MKDRWLVKIFESRYCLFVFLLSALLVSMMIPKKIFYGFYSVFGILFILTSALLFTCAVRNIKEKVKIARAQNASLLGIASLVVGVGALHSCVIGVPVCGASVGAGIIGFVFPNFVLNAFDEYAFVLVILAIAVQIYGLYSMKCFSKV